MKKILEFIVFAIILLIAISFATGIIKFLIKVALAIGVFYVLILAFSFILNFIQSFF